MNNYSGSQLNAVWLQRQKSVSHRYQMPILQRRHVVNASAINPHEARGTTHPLLSLNARSTVAELINGCVIMGRFSP